MGNFIWHDWARLVAVGASVYAIWAGYWGIFYRKFFWDFVGGTLRDPGGFQTPAGASFFTTIIIKVPLLQIFMILLGAANLSIEWPLIYLKDWSIRRSFIVKIILLLVQAVISILVYQGTNAALYSLIAALGYIRAQSLGEQVEEAKNNRGTTGRA